jgi:hypothetical protein
MTDPEMMFSAKCDQILHVQFQLRIRVERLDVMDIEILARSTCCAEWIPADEFIPDAAPL